MGLAGRWIYDRDIDDRDRRLLRPGAGDAKGEEERDTEGSGHQKSEMRTPKSDALRRRSVRESVIGQRGERAADIPAQCSERPEFPFQANGAEQCLPILR